MFSYFSPSDARPSRKWFCVTSGKTLPGQGRNISIRPGQKQFTLDKNTAKFKEAITDLLTHKISDAVEIKKVEVSSQFMSAETEGSQESDENV